MDSFRQESWVTVQGNYQLADLCNHPAGIWENVLPLKAFSYNKNLFCLKTVHLFVSTCSKSWWIYNKIPGSLTYTDINKSVTSIFSCDNIYPWLIPSIINLFIFHHCILVLKRTQNYSEVLVGGLYPLLYQEVYCTACCFQSFIPQVGFLGFGGVCP